MTVCLWADFPVVQGIVHLNKIFLYYFCGMSLFSQIEGEGGGRNGRSAERMEVDPVVCGGMSCRTGAHKICDRIRLTSTEAKMPEMNP